MKRMFSVAEGRFMKSLLHTLCSVLLVGASGVTSASGQPAVGGYDYTEINGTIDGKASLSLYKTGAVYPSEMHFAVSGKPVVKTSAPYIFLASFILDGANVRSMRETLVASCQVRIEIQLTGEDGTNADSPFKIGTYSPKAENVNGIRMLKVSTFADGKHTETSFDVMTPGAKAEGYVKVTSVIDGVVRGRIDLTEGEMFIKGTFAAKIPQAKKVVSGETNP